jgi:hypothetical protein
MPAFYTLDLDTFHAAGGFIGRTTFGKCLGDNIGARVQGYLDSLTDGESLIIDVSPWTSPDDEPFGAFDYETMRSEHE